MSFFKKWFPRFSISFSAPSTDADTTILSVSYKTVMKDLTLLESKAVVPPPDTVTGISGFRADSDYHCGGSEIELRIFSAVCKIMMPVWMTPIKDHKTDNILFDGAPVCYSLRLTRAVNHRFMYIHYRNGVNLQYRSGFRTLSETAFDYHQEYGGIISLDRNDHCHRHMIRFIELEDSDPENKSGQMVVNVQAIPPKNWVYTAQYQKKLLRGDFGKQKRKYIIDNINESTIKPRTPNILSLYRQTGARDMTELEECYGSMLVLYDPRKNTICTIQLTVTNERFIFDGSRFISKFLPDVDVIRAHLIVRKGNFSVLTSPTGTLYDGVDVVDTVFNGTLYLDDLDAETIQSIKSTGSAKIGEILKSYKLNTEILAPLDLNRESPAANFEMINRKLVTSNLTSGSLFEKRLRMVLYDVRFMGVHKQ